MLFQLRKMCLAIFATLAIVAATALAAPAPTVSSSLPDEINTRWLANCTPYSPTFSDNTLMEVNRTAKDLIKKANKYASILDNPHGTCKIAKEAFPVSHNRVNKSLLNNETQLQAFREEVLRITRSYYTLIIDRAANLLKIKDNGGLRCMNNDTEHNMFGNMTVHLKNMLCTLNKTAHHIKDEMDPSDSRRNDPVYNEGQQHSVVNTKDTGFREKCTYLLLREIEFLAKEANEDFTFLRAIAVENKSLPYL